MNVLDKLYVITLASGDRWAVPVRVIAENRAAYYAEKDGTSAEEAMVDTVELFDDNYELQSWAANEMNWSDVKASAFLYQMAEVDDADPFQDAWIGYGAEVVDPK